MRVAIVNLTAGGLSGGYLKYLKRMVPHLLQDPGIAQLDVFVPASARERLSGEPWPLHSWSSDDPRALLHLTRMVGERRPDVVFVPTANWLSFGDAKVVVMVRNMEPLEAPLAGNPPRAAARNLVKRLVARRACRRATRIIAVSRHVRDYLVDRWSVEEGKIGIVRHGADAPERGPAAAAPPGLDPGRASGFVFVAGSIRPARGLSDLIEALPHLDPRRGPIAAVVAGDVDPGMDRYRARLIRRAHALGVADRLHWTGPLGEAEMRWCYEAAGAFVMTSRVEACPNVVLEAMSHGCASVSVDHPPMPEFFGSAARYYRAGDARALAREVNAIHSRTIDVEALRAAARKRASEFDWATAARETVAELRAAIRS